MSLRGLLQKIKEPQKIDQERLKKVYLFAKKAHAGAVRYNGEKYFTHPLAVAKIVAKWKQPQAVIEAALLHDVVEETSYTIENLRDLFGEEVAFLVDGVTKIGGVRLRGSMDNLFVENLRKMFVAMAQDIRVVIIRLADRLHNMQTLDAIPLSKQKRVAEETLEIYAPLAERLGMGQVRGQLEDLSFPYVYPKEFKWINKIAKPHIERAKQATKDAKRLLEQKLREYNIPAEIHGRPKRKYSLYRKLMRPEIDQDINLVHDLVALRVVTDSKLNCYATLGLIHDQWRPVPNIPVSDFIAQPKPNGYQSIHTKVFDDNGHVIEIQIRTREMHELAEYGAASHSLYADAKSKGASNEALEKGIAFEVGRKIAWVNQLANWQRQVQNSDEYILSLKLDALSQRIYVFSPKGDVYDLPKSATPVDFAFAVHTQLGNYLQGALVNGKIVPLDFALKNGDVVEIIKSKIKRLPNRDWLRFVKTHKAREKIQKLHKH